ncbi:MAG: hypothetical protein ACFFEO_16600, partial [Candidatus Thorarchaeota archaeon]
SIIIMAEFVNLRLIVIMKENPSKNFVYSIEVLAYEIYNKYGSLFDEFQGNLAEFQGIKNLLNEHLGTSFAYPLVVDYSLKTKLPPSEREMIKRALDLMKEKSLKFFYTRQLLPENVCTPKDYETILHLIEKKIFLPIDISSD